MDIILTVSGSGGVRGVRRVSSTFTRFKFMGPTCSLNSFVAVLLLRKSVTELVRNSS